MAKVMFGRRTYTDEELVKEMRNGNKEALTHLYEANYNAIRSYVLKNNGKDDDVEDVLQEAVVAVWQKVHQPNFELTAKLSTFLYAIAKNLWLKALNKGKRQEPMEDYHENAYATETKPIDKSDLQLVVQYMNRIGETCQQLLHLFYFEELDMKEIAVQLNFANADTAKAKKYQCFKKLEKLVKSHFSKSDFIS